MNHFLQRFFMPRKNKHITFAVQLQKQNTLFKNLKIEKDEKDFCYGGFRSCNDDCKCTSVRRR